MIYDGKNKRLSKWQLRQKYFPTKQKQTSPFCSKNNHSIHRYIHSSDNDEHNLFQHDDHSLHTDSFVFLVDDHD